MSHCDVCGYRIISRPAQGFEIAAARQAISDARLLLETALVLLERKTSEERPCPME